MAPVDDGRAGGGSQRGVSVDLGPRPALLKLGRHDLVGLVRVADAAALLQRHVDAAVADVLVLVLDCSRRVDPLAEATLDQEALPAVIPLTHVGLGQAVSPPLVDGLALAVPHL